MLTIFKVVDIEYSSYDIQVVDIQVMLTILTVSNLFLKVDTRLVQLNLELT